MRLILYFLALCGAIAANPGQAAGADDLLEPEKAFRFAARAVDTRTVEISYRIADGYYLYRERFKFSIEPGLVRTGLPEFPKGQIHEDQFFGKTETYRRELRIRLPVEDASGLDRFKLKVTSQGCADAGVCYVPQEQSAEIRLAAVSIDTLSADPLARLGIASGQEGDTRRAEGSFSDSAKQGLIGGDESGFVQVLESGRIWAALAFFFAAGIALAFTPCVLPMVPILSGIIVGEGRLATRKRALLLSLCYVLGMAVTYTGIGVAAALSGQMLAAALQSAWVLWTFALIFVLLALSMFGFYELNLPSGLHARIASASHRMPGGHYGGVALMGMLSAAIVSPCVAAPLAGALLYISQTRDVWLGGSALMAMALGMGVPLMVVGVSEGALLPKSGPWMKTVKHVFGALLLGVAVWVVSPVIPVVAQMLAWGALLIGCAMFLRAIDPLPVNVNAWARLWKGVGIVALLMGAAMVVGAMAGGRDPLRPLAGLIGDAGDARDGPQGEVRFERIKTIAELDAGLASAGRPVMLDFYADWCVSCKEMERFTFSDARVRERLAAMTLLQIDVTANSPEDNALLKRFRLFGPPGIIFFDRSGLEISDVRVIGYQDAARFARALDRVAALSGSN
ncbi:MAG: protein-disulfide reductase DsbD [Betaproteobacteria bacterium]|nr:protein-disulfide reductase DsbD [Betaproteobacteria bacterium]